MKIGEVAERTELSISNIRFYEKKGLIEPKRNQDSKYRDYTEADVERLKEIILYRKMDFPIENICQILNREMDISEMLDKQISELEAKKSMLQGSIDLCQKVLTDGQKENLNIDDYLNYVKEEEKSGTRFAEIEELFDDIGSFTKISWFRGDPYVGWIFSNKWIYRAVIVILVFMWIALPVSALVEYYIENAKINLQVALYWGLCTGGIGIAFLQYRHRKSLWKNGTRVSSKDKRIK